MALISCRQLASHLQLGSPHCLQAPKRIRRVPAMGAAVCLWTALLLLTARSVSAQALTPGGPVGFPDTPVGASATDITLTFTANVATTVSKITVLADGAEGQDFTLLSQNCLGTLSPPASCLITLSFKPAQLGLRRGELILTDGNGAKANSVPLHGVGLGAQVVFSPVVAFAQTSLLGPTPATVSPASAVYDGAGNLFVLDVANNRLLEQTALQATRGTFTLAQALPPVSALSALAVAGDGTLFVSSPDTGVVYAISPGGIPAPLATGGITLQRPAGLATDGFGFLYIADNGANSLVRVALDGSGVAAFSLGSLGTPLNGPAGLAIDVNRNLYVADSGNNRIVRVSLNSGAAQALAITGATLSAPLGLAVDSALGLTVADTGNSRLVLVGSSGAAFALATPGATLSAPGGILLQPNGDLLVSDTTAGLVSISRSAMALRFATPTKVGSVDTTDDELSFTLQNTGSYALQLGGADASGLAPTISTGAYSVAGDSTCPLLSAGTAAPPLGRTATCSYRLNFKPINSGVNNATLTMALAGIGAASGSLSTIAPTASLAGTGFAVLSSFSLVITPPTTPQGAPVSVTVTALRNDGSIATDYTGTAVFASTDLTATFPGGSPNYSFTAADAGVHTFPAIAGQGWVFNTVGTFTIAAGDSADPRIMGISNAVQVVNIPVVTLTSASNPTLAGGTTVLTVSVKATVGTPSGTISFVDGGSLLGTVTLVNGTASLTVSFATAGAHTLSAAYSGDANYLPAVSPNLTQAVEDFSLSLAPGDPGKATVVNRGTANFALVLAPVGGSTLAAPVTFSVAGLPTGFTGTFAPASAAAGAGSTNTMLTVSGGRAQVELFRPSLFGRGAPIAFAAFLLPLAFLRRRRSRSFTKLLLLLAAAGACAGLGGCLSDTTAGYYGTVPATQTLTVTATSGQLTHTVTVSLTTE